MKQIEVIVCSKGVPTIRTVGFQGDECLAASRSLEAALGTVAGAELTSDYFLRRGQTESQHEHAQ